jgi:adenylate cyclase
VPSDVVAQLLKRNQEAVPEAEKRNLTLLFTDIKDFSSISEQLPPEQLADHLSEYLQNVTSILLNYGATVDKFIGDAIMAFWGAPHPVESHQEKACMAALSIQEYIIRSTPSWQTRGLPVLHTRIGINTGEVTVGNMGYKERLSYTAVGDHVNLAARLEGLNKRYKSHILISEYTQKSLADLFITRPLEKVVVKGKSTPVILYELLCHHEQETPEVKQRALLLSRAFHMLYSNQWEQAHSILKDMIQKFPHDAPAHAMLEQLVLLQNTTPPSEWLGYTIMDSK